MKQKTKHIFLAIAGLLCGYSGNAQIYANREWVREAPETGNSYNHTASVVHNGNLIVTGSVYNGSNGVDVFTIKYDGSTGDTLWYKTESGTLSGGNDYGVDLQVSNSGDVIVTAAIENSSTGYDYAVYRYTGSSGSQEWSYSWDGNSGIDIPAKILVKDNMNAIFVIGGSQASGGGMSDYGSVRIDSSGSFAWEHFYDNGNGLQDAAVSGNTAIFNQYLLVVGASQQPSGDWFTVLDMIKTSTGSTYNTSVIDTTAVTMTEARAMAIDDQNRIFVTGFSDDGGNKNIQSFALDSNLNLLWVANFEENLEDVAEDIGVDANGNVYITGYTEKSSGKFKAITIQYDAATGDTLWVQEYGNVISEDGMKGRKMAVTSTGETYITGPIYDGGVQSFAFVKYDSDGTYRASFNFEADSLTDEAFDIQVDGNDVYITGFTETISGNRMTATKYALKEKDNTIALDSASGAPLYVGRDLIIRIDSSLIRKEKIDQLEFSYWNLNEIFDSSFVSDLERNLEIACDDEHCPITVYRIFSNMLTTDTISISRSGDTIPIPQFWATFVFEFPEGVNVTDASNAIVPLFPDIKYSTYNLVGELNDVPNDPAYDESQIALHTDDTPAWPDVHINVEPAWDYETGKRHIKIGVMDGPVYWQHEDFGGADQATTKVKGYDFLDLDDIYTASTTFSKDHGTAVCGTIGAIRNNNLGIAGVAGGSYANGENLDSSGCSIYAMNILGHTDSLLILSHSANAVYGSSVYTPGSLYGFGVHIMNNSWGVGNHYYGGGTNPNPWFLDTNIVLIRESFHFANRNEVIVAASRGNSGYFQDTVAYHYNYPAVLDDDWIICVGGLGTDSNYHDDNGPTPECCYKPSRGPEIDVSCFSASSHNWTTQDLNLYNKFTATSAATPYITGLAGLLLSYLNAETDNYNNLAPEDVEYILQMTAVDRDTLTHPGYDTLTGYGIINAGAALTQVDKDKYTLAHFGTDAFPNSTTFSLYSSDDTVTLSERYENGVGDWFLPNTPYVVDTYEITSASGHIVNYNEEIIASWPRPSSSNVFMIFDANNVVMPRERIILDSVDNSYGYMRGYIYKVSDTLGNPLGWWPIDTLADFDLTYSILKSDTTVFLTTDETESPFSLKIYPNPSADSQTLILAMDQPNEGAIRLVDINGRLIQTVYAGRFEKGENIYTLDISNLSKGIYLYAIVLSDGETHYRKIIKQ